MDHTNHRVVLVTYPDVLPSSAAIHWTAVGEGLCKLRLFPTVAFHSPDERACEISSRILSRTGQLTPCQSSELHLLSDPIHKLSPLSQEERFFLERIIGRSSFEEVERRFLDGEMDRRLHDVVLTWAEQLHELFTQCWVSQSGTTLVVGHSIILHYLLTQIVYKSPDKFGFKWDSRGLVIIHFFDGKLQRSVYYKDFETTTSRASTSGGRNHAL